MRRKLIVVCAAMLCVSIALSLQAEDELARKLADWEAKIRATPDDPMLYYRKAQCLMQLGRHDEGYETAQKAMGLFVKKDSQLAWMLLESIPLDNVQIDVHFNMGPNERKPPETGILRPLSFRVWKKEPRELLEMIDFEIANFDGKPGTAAFGISVAGLHGNLGMVEPDAKYRVLREKAIGIVKERFDSVSSREGNKDEGRKAK
jgi:hypothetical protein